MPSITYKDGATLRNIVALYYMDGATQRVITEVWIGDGATKRLVWPEAGPPPGPTLAGTASPTTLYGSRATSGTATSNVVTATPTGYTGTVHYQWEYVSGDGAVSVSPSTLNASVSFIASVGPVNPLRSAVYRCKITDDTGFVYTNNVTATLEYTG